MMNLSFFILDSESRWEKIKKVFVLFGFKPSIFHFIPLNSFEESY